MSQSFVLGDCVCVGLIIIIQTQYSHKTHIPKKKWKEKTVEWQNGSNDADDIQSNSTRCKNFGIIPFFFSQSPL